MKSTFLLPSFLGFSCFDEYLFDFLDDFFEAPKSFFCSRLASRLVPIWHLIPNIFVSQTKLAFWLEWMISDVVEGVFNWVFLNIHENLCVHSVHTFVSLHSKISQQGNKFETKYPAVPNCPKLICLRPKSMPVHYSTFITNRACQSPFGAFYYRKRSLLMAIARLVMVINIKIGFACDNIGF